MCISVDKLYKLCRIKQVKFFGGLVQKYKEVLFLNFKIKFLFFFYYLLTSS